MNESAVWLNRILKAVAERQLDKGMEKSDFQKVLLYWLAAYIIERNGNAWSKKLVDTYFQDSRGLAEIAKKLMNRCGYRNKYLSEKYSTQEHLSYLIRNTLERFKHDEQLAIFDSLFFRITSEIDVDRRHSEIVAALVNGIARNNGLIDLKMISAESFIVNSHLEKSDPSYRYTSEENRLEDLSILRLIVHEIESTNMEERPYNFDGEYLTLLDLTNNERTPFNALLSRLESKRLATRTLIIFKPQVGLENEALKTLRRKLIYDDLLEVLFIFTSYNTSGRPIKLCAWLLNEKKHHEGKTLCIDTRNLLKIFPSTTAKQASWFASAISELWASPIKFRIGQFPQANLGLLQGLFSKCFRNSYQDVDGLCRIYESEQILEAPINSKFIPPAKLTETKFSLIDKYFLVNLLEESDQTPLCAYIIGDNGAGKSLLLETLANHLKEQLISSTAIANGPTDRFNVTEKKDIYRYMGDRSQGSNSKKTTERRIFNYLKEVFKLKGNIHLVEKILELVDLKGRIYLAPNEIFNDLLPPDALIERVKPLSEALLHGSALANGMTLALSRQNDHSLIKFSALSSGEQQILLLFSKMVAGAGTSDVLLIDEPEISLHVRWQQLLPTCFSLIAQELSTQLIIATHSPTLISNAQDNISHCFLAKNQQLFPIPPEKRHSVETILLEGFETYTPHNREIAERCAALVAKTIRAINRDQNSNTELQQALLNELENMNTIMEKSGNPQDKRYISDQQLIIKARDAIIETFQFAQKAP